MRAIVTGGAGFIGSHLVDALVERGDEVVVVDDLSSGKRENVNPAARSCERDIRGGLDARRRGCRLPPRGAGRRAGLDARGPPTTPWSTSSAPCSVLEAAREAGAQVVFTSTGGAIYGECDGPASEDAPREPLSPYGIAKLCARGVRARLEPDARHRGTSSCGSANVYGPRQDAGLEGGVVAIFLERMARGEETVDLRRRRRRRATSSTSATSCARCSRRPGARAASSTSAPASRRPCSTLHRACAGVAGVGAEPRFEAARLGDVRRSVLDVSLAARELGWRPEVGLEDGLRLTLEG